MQAGSKALAFALFVVVAAVALALAFGSGSDSQPPGASQAGATRADQVAAGAGSALSVQGDAERDPGRVEVGDATPPSDRKTVLTGRLVQQQNPVPGVRIRYSVMRRMGGEGVEGSPIPAMAGDFEATDHDGRFRFLVPVSKRGLLALDQSDHVFAGVTGGFLSVPATTGDLDLGDIEIATGAVLAGVVRDRMGGALEGVQVELARSEGVRIMSGFGERKTETDAAGRFRFGGLLGASYRVSTASPKYLPSTAEVEVSAGASRDDVVLTLDSGASIWGRVVDDLGRPVADAKVGAYRTRQVDEAVTMRALSDGESVRTNSAGEFELGGIQEDAVTVRASRSGHASTSEASVAKGTNNLVLTMVRNGVLEGRLIDTAGQPIAGSVVHAISEEHSGFMHLRQRGDEETDADGSFRLEDIPAGKVTVEAIGDDHVPVSAQAEVRPGEATDNIRLVAARGATVEALVVDHAGEPVAGARVVVKEAPREHAQDGTLTFRSRTVERSIEDGHGHQDVVIDDGSPKNLGTAVTGADGIARIGGLPAGQVEVAAAHETLAPSLPQELTLASSGVAETKLELREGGSVELRVVDTDHIALADTTVAVAGPQLAAGSAETRSVKTNSDGVANLTQLPAGLYSAAITLPPRPVSFGNASIMLADGGMAELEGSRVEFTVRSGETAQALLVRPTLTTLTGMLTSASGPVARGKVQLSRDSEEADIHASIGGGYSDTTDAEGRFSIEGLPAGNYTLSYGRRGQAVLAQQQLELHGERELQHDLELNGGTIEVVVIGDDGEPLRKAKVTVQRQAAEGAPVQRRAMFAMVSIDSGGGEQSMEIGGNQPVVRTDEDGRALVEDVPAGTYDVAIEHSRHVKQSLPDVEVRRGEVHSLGVIELAAGGAVRGVVVDDKGGSPMVANVEILRVGDAEPQTTMAMQGAFRFTGLAPGVYRVRGRAIDSGPQAAWGPDQEIEVRAGKTERVTLPLQ